MPKSGESFQEIVRRRRQTGFIARGQELAAFRTNLGLPVDSPDRRFVVSVHGDGGVGKSSLLGQLRRIATEDGSVVATVDAPVFGVPQAMRTIAEDFAAAGFPLKQFAALYETYLQRRLEAESDPQAPAGLASFMTRSAIRAGLHAAALVPGVGGVIQEVDAGALADQADRLRAYLGAKFRRHDDVHMLLSPLEVLTPVFVAELAAVGCNHPVALFVDTYEQAELVLDGWLRAVLDGVYGELPADVLLTIAGRNPLDYDAWAPFLDVRLDMPLAPFTATEARQLLASKGVHDQHVAEVILAVSGMLPLWLATLADNQPIDPGQIGDPSGKAVERFLKWETDPGRRTLAIAAAAPRTLNEDVVGVLIDGQVPMAGTEPERQTLFSWLRSQPFVTDNPSGCRYHDVVRAAMLRMERGHSPTRWRRRHLLLAEAHRVWQSESCAADAWDDSTWLAHELEGAYHSLCADPGGALPAALEGAVYAFAHGAATIRRWVQMLRQAAEDAEAEAVGEWGRRLEEYLRLDADQGLVQAMTALINDAALPTKAAGNALQTRGRGLYLLGRDEEALADFTLAVQLEPQDRQAWAYRGDAYRWLGRFDEALADFEKAVGLDPSYGWAIASRGETYRRMGRYEQAMDDFDRAIALNPNHSYAFASRGETYRRTRRYQQAIADLDRAVSIHPTYAWALASRAETYLEMDRLEQALEDFGAAVELQPDYAWALANRGRTLRKLGRYEQALADFDRAISIKADYAWAIANRAETYHRMERYEDAVAGFNQAVELDGEYAWALVGRARVHRRMAEYELALADAERAIAIDPHDDWYHYCAAQAHACQGNLPAATEQLRTAVDLVMTSHTSGSPAEAEARHLFNLAVYHAALGEFEQAADRIAAALGREPTPRECAYAMLDLRDLGTIPGTRTTEIDGLIATIEGASAEAARGSDSPPDR